MRPRSLALTACSAFLLVVISLLALMTPAPTIAAQGDLPSPGLAKGHAKDVVLVGFEPGTSKVKKGVAARSVGATDVEPLSPLAPDTVVMKLPPGQTVEKAIEKLEKQSGVKYAEPDYYVTTAETSTTPTTLMAAFGGCTATPHRPRTRSGRVPTRPGRPEPSAAVASMWP